jgi:hypothetical protein
MLEGTLDASRLDEPLDEFLVYCVIGILQQMDRDFTIEEGVASAVQSDDPGRTNFFEDVVPRDVRKRVIGGVG